MQWLVILAYLGAIVLANLSVTYLGPTSTPFNALLLVAFDLASRDALHESWSRHGRFGLWWRMLLLIGAGGVLSYLLNANAARIAIASVTAFVAAGLADAIVYAWLKAKGKGRVVRANGSNVVSATVDSFVFIGCAFGWPILWQFAIFQTLAKVFGGTIWTAIFVKTGLWKETTAGGGVIK